VTLKKPLELLPAAARRFVENMLAFRNIRESRLGWR
jgi:hypothetical protein